MQAARIPMVSADDPVTAEGENEVRGALNELLGLSVDPSTLELLWTGRRPHLRGVATLRLAHFWTTGTITASASAGTTVSTATLTQGSGNARRCVYDDSASKYKPDVATGAADETIYNDVNASIASGQFVLCAFVDGRWLVILANCG